MDIYKMRVELPFTEEFKEIYLEEMKAAVQRTAEKIGEKFGAEAKRNIESNAEKYIAYTFYEKNF